MGGPHAGAVCVSDPQGEPPLHLQGRAASQPERAGLPACPCPHLASTSCCLPACLCVVVLDGWLAQEGGVGAGVEERSLFTPDYKAVLPEQEDLPPPRTPSTTGEAVAAAGGVLAGGDAPAAVTVVVKAGDHDEEHEEATPPPQGLAAAASGEEEQQHEGSSSSKQQHEEAPPVVVVTGQQQQQQPGEGEEELQELPLDQSGGQRC